MEDILEVYHLPYDIDYPVVCLDESNKQLVGEVRTPMLCIPGHPQYIDDEYVRNGVADIFMAVEPLTGKRYVTVTERRTRTEWAKVIKQLLDEYYPQAKKVRLVVDNLNIHSIASLYEAFPPEEALHLAERLGIHFTPRHGSWLNMAEIELSVLQGQCLNRRIPDMQTIKTEITAWQDDRNNREATINWQFRTDTARIKLKSLYPRY